MSDNFPRELHSRSSAGFVLPVRAGERARDVFDHPYAYAGVPTAGRVVAA